MTDYNDPLEQVGEMPIFDLSARKPCAARYIVEALADPMQDERMKCARFDGHSGRHTNEACDLAWETGAEISIRAILDEDEH